MKGIFYRLFTSEVNNLWPIIMDIIYPVLWLQELFKIKWGFFAFLISIYLNYLYGCPYHNSFKKSIKQAGATKQILMIRKK